MTIHDPEVEVTCDCSWCSESVYLTMKYSVSGYDLSASEVEKILSSDHEWITVGTKHYCHKSEVGK